MSIPSNYVNIYQKNQIHLCYVFVDKLVSSKGQEHVNCYLSSFDDQKVLCDLVDHFTIYNTADI